MKAVIFANGDLDPDFVQLPEHEDILVLAANGGSLHCQRLGLRPDILIGDLDSLPDHLLEEWRRSGVKILAHPPRKDETDLELALKHAQKLGAENIVVYGALGKRLDMTLTNFFLLAHPALDCELEIRAQNQRLLALKGGCELTIAGQPGDMLSLIPLVPRTRGITTHNLEYPLTDEALRFGATRGISNVFQTDQVKVSLDDGVLAVIHTPAGAPDGE